MKCELTSVETSDGLTLHGAFYEGNREKPALILLHGAAMNFYTGLGRFLPNLINPRDYACLTANNRGHDFGTAPDGDKKPVLGLMRERFQDCVLDIEAWVDFLEQRGYRRIILVGHSQANTKILYALNQRQLEAVLGLVLVSPPPSAPNMMRYLVGDNFYERGLFKAQEVSELGADGQLIILRSRGTMPWIFTAGTFLSFYGPNSPTDTEELCRNIYLPSLLIRGSNDFEPISRELLTDMKGKAGRPEAFTIMELQGADHFYSEHEEQLGEIILEWLDGLN